MFPAPVLALDQVTTPVLLALVSPLLAPGGGGGPAVTLQGQNLATVTSVTVGGASATSVSSTATSVTFTFPAGTPSATPVDVVFTSAAGRCALKSCVYYLPLSITHCLAATQGYTQGGPGPWVDVVGSVSFTIAGSNAAPTFAASWSNGQPAISFVPTATSGQYFTGTTTTQNQPGAVFGCGEFTTSASATSNAMYSGGTSTTAWMLINSTSGNSVQLYAGTLATVTSTQLTGKHFHQFTVANPNGGALIKDGTTTLASGLNVGTRALSNIKIGALYTGTSDPMSGFIALVAHSSASGTQLATDGGVMHGICQGIWGVP